MAGREKSRRNPPRRQMLSAVPFSSTRRRLSALRSLCPYPSGRGSPSSEPSHPKEMRAEVPAETRRRTQRPTTPRPPNAGVLKRMRPVSPVAERFRTDDDRNAFFRKIVATLKVKFYFCKSIRKKIELNEIGFNRKRTANAVGKLREPPCGHARPLKAGNDNQQTRRRMPKRIPACRHKRRYT